MRVGGLTIDRIIDGTAFYALAEALEHPRGLAWDCPDQPLDARGRLAMDVGAWLVRGGGRTVLVDAGVGPLDKPHARGGDLLAGLSALGVGPQDVTDLVFTHLHFDHVGWATQQGKPVFACATVHVHAADWAHFVTGPAALPGAQRKLLPLAGRLAAFDADGEILPGLSARHAPGHSPGSTAFLLHDSGEQALLLGDVAHALPELTDPDWLCLFDLDPAEGRRTRVRMLAEAARLGLAFSASHLPGLCFVRLEEGGRRYRIVEGPGQAD